jgi:hypothetical protein
MTDQGIQCEHAFSKMMISYCNLSSSSLQRKYAILQLNQPASDIKISDLKKIIYDWGCQNLSSNRMTVMTPLQDGDEDRSLEDWAMNPTVYQIETGIYDENQKYYSYCGCHGIWIINFE